MAADEDATETVVSAQGDVTVPDSLRQTLDIEPGDKLRWTLDANGAIRVEVIDRQSDTFEDFEPVSMGGGGTEDHDLAGYRSE